ncbi:MAG: hypothetical protein HY843_09220, partial [Bdellovibrio sp.]|nr:hypothetical protein [Bdellovibrio sp.]
MTDSYRQVELFAQATKINIALDENHELVRFTKEIDWDDLIEEVMEIRAGKIKKATGPVPHYREL